MTREELKEHCKKQIEMCEMWAKAKGENPCGKVYEEHKMILELLEQQPCEDWCEVPSYEMTLEQARQAVRDLRKFVMDNHVLPKLQPCEDAVSRQAVLEQINCWIGSGEYRYTNATDYLTRRMQGIPPVKPQYTEAEIQKMQELEQAEIQKAYELGKAEQPCEDAISREAVIDMTGLSEWFDSSDSYDEFVIALSNLPPVIPQPKTGRWIDDKCSVCGKGTEDLIESSEWYRNKSPKYCPFCGIKIQPYKAESEG